MSLEALRCPSCVAPVEIAGGGIVQTCRYCGTTLRVGSGGEVSDVLEFCSSEADVRDAVRRRVGTGGQLSIGRVLVPAFFVSATAEGRWSAEIITYFKDGRAKGTPKTGGPVKRTYRHQCVLAADGPWSVAFCDLGQRALAAVPLRADHLTGVTVLEVEGTARQRETRAEANIRGLHQAEVLRAVPPSHRRFACTIDVKGIQLQRVLVPTWVCVFHNGSGEVRGFVDDETCRVHLQGDPAAAAVLGTVAAAVGASGLTMSAMLGVLFMGLVFLMVCCGLSTPPPRPATDVVTAASVPPPSSSPPPIAANQVRTIKPCDVAAFDASGRPVSKGRLASGEVLDVVARDDRSIQFVYRGDPAWVPTRCVEGNL